MKKKWKNKKKHVEKTSLICSYFSLLLSLVHLNLLNVLFSLLLVHIKIGQKKKIIWRNKSSKKRKKKDKNATSAKHTLTAVASQI